MPAEMQDMESEESMYKGKYMKKTPGIVYMFFCNLLNFLKKILLGLGRVFWIAFAVSVCTFSLGIIIGNFGISNEDCSGKVHDYIMISSTSHYSNMIYPKSNRSQTPDRGRSWRARAEHVEPFLVPHQPNTLTITT
jgi:hypothetical protein